jgi:hypothetical protein
MGSDERTSDRSLAATITFRSCPGGRCRIWSEFYSNYSSLLHSFAGRCGVRVRSSCGAPSRRRPAQLEHLGRNRESVELEAGRAPLKYAVENFVSEVRHEDTRRGR